jgi:hypothetical protein
MTRESTANVSHLFQLTEEEAVTLRRVALGQSELRSLRRVDIDRLLKLRLIAETRNNLKLTVSGQEHFESLPRASFAEKPRQRDSWQRN